MNEWITMLIPFAAGLLLGLIFFGGLWLTVSYGMVSGSPAMWFVLSTLLRTGVVLLGFYLVAAGQLARLIACLLGFIIAKIFFTGRFKIRERPISLSKNKGHDQS